MNDHHCIDLEHMGLPGAIACYLVDGDEPAIIDPGPTTTMERLIAELAQRGVGAKDLKHVLLTHVHLDHAGAAGWLLDHFVNARLYVHEDGAPHMIDPARLVASTRRTFGDLHDELWGEVRPAPADRVDAWSASSDARVAALRPVATPGHIAHHLAYLDEDDGTMFCGDAMGIALAGGPEHPPTPPPGVHLEDWYQTLETIGQIAPTRFAATHFGFYADVEARRVQLLERLRALEARVRAAVAEGREAEDAAAFERQVRDELAPFMGERDVHRYFDVFPAATDWAGVRHYVKKHP